MDHKVSTSIKPGFEADVAVNYDSARVIHGQLPAVAAN